METRVMMRCFVGLVLLVVTTVPSFAQTWTKEPTTFLNIPFGATKAEAEKVLGNPIPRYTPTTWRYIHDVDSANGLLRFFLVGSDDNGFESVTLDFPSDEFSFVVDLFRHKYGKNTGEEKETVTNRMGGSFFNQSVIWEGKNVVIEVKRFSASLDKGEVVITTAKGRARRAADYKAFLEKVAKQF